MKTHDAVPLSKLHVGDCFQFAHHAIGNRLSEEVPKWKLLNVEDELCDVLLEKPPAALSHGRFPSVPGKLASSTLVRPV
jgi:hypothetical protein